MSEMETYEPNPLGDLLDAIKGGSADKVQEILEGLEPGVQLSEDHVSAAETIGNSEIVEAIIDHVIIYGVNPPHDCPNQFHWMIDRGFRLSAVYLAEIAMPQDLAEKNEDGYTSLELAQQKGYSDVVAALESAESEQAWEKGHRAVMDAMNPEHE